MQYTSHYNLNLPEGTDIVNPLVQDNPNYTAIDTALYNNKLRVVGTATHVKTGTNHAITLVDSDIVAFKFIATGDYTASDTFTVDGVTVTARVADNSSIPSGAFKINSTVLCILDGTVLNLVNITGTPVVNPSDIILSNGKSVEDAIVRGSVSVTAASNSDTYADLLAALYTLTDVSKIDCHSKIKIGNSVLHVNSLDGTSIRFSRINELTTSGQYMVIEYLVYRSNPSYRTCTINTSGASFSDTLGNGTPGAGTKIELFY